MLPLTLTTPKPLLVVAGQPLIVHQIRRLVSAGYVDLVINVAYLGEQIVAALGDGSAWNCNITYSVEKEPLETAGGICHALPLLGDQPFLLINSDIWCDFPLHTLRSVSMVDADAHLVLVPNPEHHRGGDFSLSAHGNVTAPMANAEALTFSGISVIHPRLVRDYPAARSKFPLVEPLKYAAARGRLRGELFKGVWVDVGTPGRLDEVARFCV